MIMSCARAVALIMSALCSIPDSLFCSLAKNGPWVVHITLWPFAWVFQSDALQCICHTSTGYDITALHLRYSAYDVIVYVRSQALYLRYSACDIILETKVTFMMESKTGFEISTKVTCQS